MRILLESLYAELTGRFAITSHVGARIYPNHLPQSPTFPAVVFRRKGSRLYPQLHGTNDVRRTKLVVEVYNQAVADSFFDACDVMEAIYALLTNDGKGFSGRWNGANGVKVLRCKADEESENAGEIDDFIPPESGQGRATDAITQVFIVDWKR